VLVLFGLLATLFAVTVFAQVPVEIPPEHRFKGYEGAPELSVLPRKDELFFYPCDQCHATMEPNPEIRELSGAPHDAELNHGKGRIWCTSCHRLEDRNNLKTLLDEPVDFDQSHLVCGGCHSNRHRDWVFGAHGKRVGNWQGERILNSCPVCHNPHDPAIGPRKPEPPPPVRAGLELEEGHIHLRPTVWESREENQDHEQ
jgi:hypothetical protein